MSDAEKMRLLMAGKTLRHEATRIWNFGPIYHETKLVGGVLCRLVASVGGRRNKWCPLRQLPPDDCYLVDDETEADRP